MFHHFFQTGNAALIPYYCKFLKTTAWTYYCDSAHLSIGLLFVLVKIVAPFVYKGSNNIDIITEVLEVILEWVTALCILPGSEASTKHRQALACLYFDSPRAQMENYMLDLVIAFMNHFVVNSQLPLAVVLAMHNKLQKLPEPIKQKLKFYL